MATVLGVLCLAFAASNDSYSAGFKHDSDAAKDADAGVELAARSRDALRAPGDVSPSDGRTSSRPSDTLPLSHERTVVALGRRGRFTCSGVLIAPDRVLTASHCLPVDEVRGGVEWARPVYRSATERVLGAHPRFDVAVISLASPFSDEQPLAVLDLDVHTPQRVAAIGFGAEARAGLQTDGGVRRARELQVTTPLCLGRRAALTGCTPYAEWVVGAVQGVDTCEGDSGGGLFVPHGAGWRLAGIVSRGVLSRRRSCGDGGIYVRLGAVADWLNFFLEREG